MVVDERVADVGERQPAQAATASSAQLADATPSSNRMSLVTELAARVSSSTRNHRAM